MWWSWFMYSSLIVQFDWFLLEILKEIIGEKNTFHHKTELNVLWLCSQTGILFCFSGAVVLAHCIPLDRDVIKDRREPLSPVVVNSAFPVQSAIEELMSKQFGGGLLGGGLGGGGGGGNFGSVLAGSVIGSGLATILPLLLRPALLGATALIPRRK